MFKACFRYFRYFCQEKALKNFEKCFLFYWKSSFLSQDLFSPVGHCWIYGRSWMKVSPKDHDVTKFLLCSSFFSNVVSFYGNNYGKGKVPRTKYQSILIWFFLYVDRFSFFNDIWPRPFWSFDSKSFLSKPKNCTSSWCFYC